MAMTQRVLSDPSMQRLFNQQDLRDLFSLSDNGGGLTGRATETQLLLPDGCIDLASSAANNRAQSAQKVDGRESFSTAFLAGQEDYVDADACPSDAEDSDASSDANVAAVRGRPSSGRGAPQTAVLQSLFGQGQLSGAMSHDAAELSGAERSFIERHAARVARRAARSLPTPEQASVDSTSAATPVNNVHAGVEGSHSTSSASPDSQYPSRRTAATLIGRLSSRLLWAGRPGGNSWAISTDVAAEAPYVDYSRGRRMLIRSSQVASCFADFRLCSPPAAESTGGTFDAADGGACIDDLSAASSGVCAHPHRRQPRVSESPPHPPRSISSSEFSASRGLNLSGNSVRASMFYHTLSRSVPPTARRLALRSIKGDIRGDASLPTNGEGPLGRGLTTEVEPDMASPLLSGPILLRMAQRRLVSASTIAALPVAPTFVAQDDSRGRTFASLLSAMGGRRRG